MPEIKKRSLGPLIGAIDQGTSSTRFLIFSAKTGELITYHQLEMAKIYPAEGWVEQDPMQIIATIKETMAEVARKLESLGIDKDDVKAIGLCNQRESTIVWDPNTGKPYYNSIVWLDNRTTGIVDHYLDAIPGRDINFHKVHYHADSFLCLSLSFFLSFLPPFPKLLTISPWAS